MIIKNLWSRYNENSKLKIEKELTNAISKFSLQIPTEFILKEQEKKSGINLIIYTRKEKDGTRGRI